MVTPPSTERGHSDLAGSPCPGRKRAPEEQETSASPVLKKGKADPVNMKRTPQPNLTQPKLTSMLQSSTMNVVGSNAGDAGPVPPNSTTCPPLGGPGETLSADFFRKLIGDNTATITAKLDKVTGDLASLSRTVEASKAEIASVHTEVRQNALNIAEQKSQVEFLADRISRLENGETQVKKAKTLSPAYLIARRSVRMWPIENTNANTLWKGVGEFLHKALGISEGDIGPDDIESVTAIPDPKYTAGNLNKEALVTFFCPRKRDIVVSSSPNLSNLMDKGLPTAGLRLEIPEELMGQFRLLSRFGTRLRARHGTGTKRHVKFDDVDGSLFMNIKLPGDEAWSKVTVETARLDMEKTARDESASVLRRIQSKPMPQKVPLNGPRERLAVLAPAGDPSDARSRPSQDARSAQGPRPRSAWAPREEVP